MNNIETIYYTATTTDPLGAITSITTAEYSSPFIIFGYVFMITIITLLVIGIYKFLRK